MGFINRAIGAENKYSTAPAELTNNDYSGSLSSALSKAASPEEQRLNQIPADTTAGKQSTLADALLAQSQGGGVAGQLVDAQLQQATNQNNAQTASQIGSIKGINPALAARMIAEQGAQNQQQAANSSAQLKGNIALTSQQAAGGVLSNQRQQDLGQQGQQIAQQQANTMKQQAATGLVGTIGQLQNQQNQVNVQNQLGAAGINAGVAAQNANQNANTAGGILGGVASAASMFSDERLKTDVKEFEPKSFLDALKGYEYEYKDPSMGEGKQVGVMAQDVEKQVPQIVEDTPRGKVIDYNKAGGPILASLASINDRLKQLEGDKPKGYAQGGMIQGASPFLPGVDTGIVNYIEPGKNFSSGMASGKAAISHESSPSTPMTDAGYTMPELGASLPKPSMPTLSGTPTGGPAQPSLGAFMLSKGGMLPKDMTDGGHVPGQAKVNGDSPKNDTVPAMLSPGEIVIPRTKAQDPEKAKQFVEAIRSKHEPEASKHEEMPVKDEKHQDKVLEFIDALKKAKERPKSAVEPKEGYAKVLHSHRQLDQRLKQLESLAKNIGAK